MNELQNECSHLTMKPVSEPTLAGTDSQPSTMKKDECWHIMRRDITGDCSDNRREDIQGSRVVSDALEC